MIVDDAEIADCSTFKPLDSQLGAVKINGTAEGYEGFCRQTFLVVAATTVYAGFVAGAWMRNGQ